MNHRTSLDSHVQAQDSALVISDRQERLVALFIWLGSGVVFTTAMAIINKAVLGVWGLSFWS